MNMFGLFEQFQMLAKRLFGKKSTSTTEPAPIFGLRWIMLVPIVLSAAASLRAEPLPLKRAVELALAHSTAAAQWQSDEQRAFASYQEAKNQYLPQLVVSSGLGQSWGYPLSLEGSAPSLVNVTSQSAVFNASLRDFIKAAKTDWTSSLAQSKDQRDQLIQDTVLNYAELVRWQALLIHLQEQQTDATKNGQAIQARVQEGVDNPLLLKQAQLTSARANLRILQARGSIDLLRMRLAKLTGLPAASVESVPESVPALPEIKQEDDLGSKAVDYSPAVRAADIHAQALTFRARGEHRALWPTLDFAAQYALLSTFNNYENFFRANSFQPNNATIGVVFRFPLLNFSQFAHARAADAEALHSKKQAEATRNQVSEETLRLQRSVAQLAAAQEVASLEYDIAQSNFEAVQVRIDAGTATLRESADANSQAGDRFNALQDANFELQKTRIALLRATGDLESWIGLSK